MMCKPYFSRKGNILSLGPIALLAVTYMASHFRKHELWKITLFLFQNNGLDHNNHPYCV
jgi:hypothetical protein